MPLILNGRFWEPIKYSYQSYQILLKYAYHNHDYGHIILTLIQIFEYYIDEKKTTFCQR